MHVQVLDLPNLSVIESLHFFSGIFAGVGYAALFGLIAHRLRTPASRRSLPARALTALGRRSLSGYLAQSVLYGPLLAAWGLGLGAYLSSWSAMLIAIAIWLLTITAALRLERSHRRGPAEALLRRLTYRTTQT